MSNDLIGMDGDFALAPFPGGKAVEIIKAPVRAIAPVLRVVAQCEPELAALWKETEHFCYASALWDGRGSWPDALRVEKAKFTREKLLPRAVQVRQAWNALSTICDGEHNVDGPMALKMISVLQRVLIKKKDDPVTLMAFAGLFDQEIDDLGVSLNLWKEVPRHPVVVAFAILRLFHKQVFAPAPAELCDACRTVADRLKNKRRNAGEWLSVLAEADINLFRCDPDEWASIYTTSESLGMAAAFADLCRGGEGEELRELRSRRDVAIQELREGGADG